MKIRTHTLQAEATDTPDAAAPASSEAEEMFVPAAAASPTPPQTDDEPAADDPVADAVAASDAAGASDAEDHADEEEQGFFDPALEQLAALDGFQPPQPAAQAAPQALPPQDLAAAVAAAIENSPASRMVAAAFQQQQQQARAASMPKPPPPLGPDATPAEATAYSEQVSAYYAHLSERRIQETVAPIQDQVQQLVQVIRQQQVQQQQQARAAALDAGISSIAKRPGYQWMARGPDGTPSAGELLVRTVYEKARGQMTLEQVAAHMNEWARQQFAPAAVGKPAAVPKPVAQAAALADKRAKARAMPLAPGKGARASTKKGLVAKHQDAGTWSKLPAEMQAYYKQMDRKAGLQ